MDVIYPNAANSVCHASNDRNSLARKIWGRAAPGPGRQKGSSTNSSIRGFVNFDFVNQYCKLLLSPRELRRKITAPWCSEIRNVFVNFNFWIRCDEADSSVRADDLFPGKWPKSIGFDAGFTWRHLGVK